MKWYEWIVGIAISFAVMMWLLVGYGMWVRHQNLKRPCVPYHAGMTLEPGQCTVVPVEVTP